ncbi:dicer-like 4 isoform X3 [Carex rostrata]
MDDRGTISPSIQPKDPRKIARKYQIDLCKKALEENVIVYLGTGCGKTHIAVLLMYELGDLIRKPSKEVCVFLAPTVPLVRQQALVIENSTDFKVRCHHGNRKGLKDHSDWNLEIEHTEVLVMTPQIFLHILRHCFLKMDLVSLLIFDECHHAQAQTRHPYAQIMKEFYRSDAPKRPRIFGMTASPIIGKGGSNKLNYTKCINSLEQLLDAKVYSVDDNLELDSIAASPDVEVYFYGPKSFCNSRLPIKYSARLDNLKIECSTTLGGSLDDMNEYQKKMKSLSKLHENLVFCLEHIGLYGALQAARILLASDRGDLGEYESDTSNGECLFRSSYLNGAVSILSHNLVDNGESVDSLAPETFEEPFFSQKLLCLIEVLSKYRMQEMTKCIIFVKRIIVARSLAYILGNLSNVNFWKCEFLVGCNSGSKTMSRQKMNAVTERFCNGEVNLLVATSVAEEGLDIQTCCLVVRFDLPESVASFIQSRGRARMMESKYIFLLEKGNQHDEKLIEDFKSAEIMMNSEIGFRSSEDTFDTLEETVYRVDTTGASISTGCSISLLYRYCGNLPRDKYFTPSPNFYYMDDKSGIICRVVLPPNAALRQVDSEPCFSKDMARRNACLKACQMLHNLGALTDYLLPDVASKRKGSTMHSSESKSHEDENLREELHEMRLPALLKESWLSSTDKKVNMHSYYIRFLPKPDDRNYRMFGLFLISRLPEEAESLEVDLHLTHCRIVKTGLNWLGLVSFDKEEMKIAQNFQEMFLKIVLDRVEFSSGQIALGKDTSSIQHSNSLSYLLLPLKQHICSNNNNKLVVDWATMRHCLSSPIFGNANSLFWRNQITIGNSLKMKDGEYRKHDIVGSLIYTPHNGIFFFVDDILYELNATSQLEKSTYAEHFKERFKIELSHPEQPLLKVKQLFNVHNLLLNRNKDNKEARELTEHFVELPPELCCVKILGFSKDIGSSLSLLPSFMHRLENLLVAIELKHLMLSSFSEASLVRAECILEALTTEKCMERLSLERFEVLGDAFLKYVVGRHSFISFEGLDEGKLTWRRSCIVNNLNLYVLAIKKDLQVFIREPFEPSQFFALGHPCTKFCTKDNESILHPRKSKTHSSSSSETLELATGGRCTRAHRWLHGKTIADMVEALVGAFLVESGFKAAFAFLRWIGIEIDFKISDYEKACHLSYNNLSLVESMNIDALEETIGHEFRFKGLLMEALIHPSYNKHSGGCYQRLEFLGDAVLEYLITSYIYSVYPDLKPGQMTDLRSIAVNNTSLAHVAVRRSLHKHLVKDSNGLTTAINKFEQYVALPDCEKELVEEPACPKVLGDVVESCVGAVLLDTGLDLKQVWSLMLDLLVPALSFSDMQINSLRELRELCQSSNFELKLPDPVKKFEVYDVNVEVGIGGNYLTFTATNRSSKEARKMAAQKALLKLKALGHKHKNKTLEEILRTTPKQKAKLIGFDEELLVIETYSSSTTDKFSKLSIKEVKPDVKFKSTSENGDFCSSLTGSAVEGKADSNLKNGLTGDSVAVVRRGELNGASYIHINTDNYEETGLTTCKTSRSQLFEICAACYWNKPIFECCKREGPDHQPLYYLLPFSKNYIVQAGSLSKLLCKCKELNLLA